MKTHPDRLGEPLSWRKPRRVFVCSMSDLFHPSVPFGFIDEVFAVMVLAEEHTFQILTKRPERMEEYLNRRSHMGKARYSIEAEMSRRGVSGPNAGWPIPNIWLGTSVENQETADERIPHLVECPAVVRFPSCEPLFGPVILNGWDGETQYNWLDPEHSRAIHWVIAGGESGPGARPMHPAWVRSLRDQCQVAGAPFFFKQWGSWAPNCLCDTKEPHPIIERPKPGLPGCMFKCGKKAAGRELGGETYEEFPQTDEPEREAINA